MLQPNAIVLYVDDLAVSAEFYGDLLGIQPEEASPSFNSFSLTNQMGLGLKAKHTVLPPSEKNSSGELVFILETNDQVDEYFAEWQKKGITMAQLPTTLNFGYTFLAIHPDGNRLRVISLAKLQ